MKLQTYYFLPINDKTPKLFCGNSLDIKTYGQRAKVINDMITYIDTEISIIRTRISNNIDSLETERGNRINDIREFTGFDYLKRKLTLQKIIAENRIVAITQFFIIFLFLPTAMCKRSSGFKRSSFWFIHFTKKRNSGY